MLKVLAPTPIQQSQSVPHYSNEFDNHPRAFTPANTPSSPPAVLALNNTIASSSVFRAALTHTLSQSDNNTTPTPPDRSLTHNIADTNTQQQRDNRWTHVTLTASIRQHSANAYRLIRSVTCLPFRSSELATPMAFLYGDRRIAAVGDSQIPPTRRSNFVLASLSHRSSGDANENDSYALEGGF